MFFISYNSLSKFLAVASCLLLSACVSVMKDTSPDPITGLFPTMFGSEVITNKRADIDSKKQLLLVEVFHNGGSNYFDTRNVTDYHIKQLRKLNYFDEIYTLKDLELSIINNGLSDEITSLDNPLAISRAAKNYKPFLWLTIEIDMLPGPSAGNRKLTLIDPTTLEKLLIVEAHPNQWGVIATSDEAVRFPLYNALIEYIRQNSKGFK